MGRIDPDVDIKVRWGVSSSTPESVVISTPEGDFWPTWPAFTAMRAQAEQSQAAFDSHMENTYPEADVRAWFAGHPTLLKKRIRQRVRLITSTLPPL